MKSVRPVYGRHLMKMQDLLREHVLGNGDLACYDKMPGRAYFVQEEAVQETNAPHRVMVPMKDVALMRRSPDDLLFALLQHVAELGAWVDYKGSFDSIRSYFAAQDLPLATLIQHPSLRLKGPDGVGILQWDRAPKDRFYCLTSADLLGRIPIRHAGRTTFDTQGTSVTMEQRGFLVYTPKGILTAFVDH